MRAFIDANLLIYLNTVREPTHKRLYRSFYEEVVSRHRCFTNALVLDEALYVSNKKYGFSYKDTAEMIHSQVLPFVEVLPVGLQEYRKMAEILQGGGFKPSDALHLSSMLLNNIDLIVSEDAGFDAWSGIERVWFTGSRGLG
jgi:predicted nucleic acid-binding protein